MATDYQRGYSKGYSAGLRNVWGAHLPPRPPDAAVARLMDALEKMTATVDDECAKMGDDPWVELFGPLVDEARAALADVTKFCRAARG